MSDLTDYDSIGDAEVFIGKYRRIARLLEEQTTPEAKAEFEAAEARMRKAWADWQGEGERFIARGTCHDRTGLCIIFMGGFPRVESNVVDRGRGWRHALGKQIAPHSTKKAMTAPTPRASDIMRTWNEKSRVANRCCCCVGSPRFSRC